MRQTQYLLFVLLIGLSACTAQTDKEPSPSTLAQSQADLQQKQTRLQALRDSLPIKIQQNIASGMSPEKAKSVENAIIRMQEIAVQGADYNVQIQVQKKRIAKAQNTLQQEQAYLQTLRDSLPIKVQQNIKLGIPPDKAEAVEQSLIKMQETVVNVAQHNLHAQQNLFQSLSRHQP